MIDWTIVLVVVFAVVVIYVVERYTRQKPVEVSDALKLGALGGAVTGGVLYTIGEGGGAATTELLDAATSAAQDMFVGKPSF
jgi:TRAP-type C4-dicarboxylate transport system permease small subunit